MSSAPSAPSGSGPFSVWLIRHGSTEWSQSGRHTGSTDLPLTPDGERAAASLRPLLASRTFALVLSSPLKRARDTAQLAGLSPEIEPDLHEWNYGDYEGRRTVDIRKERPDWSLWTDGAPGGEQPAQVGERADRVIARLRAASGDAIVFAHGHLLRVLGARWIGSPPSAGAHLLLGTAAVCVLGWERETPAIARWNDTSHVDHAAAAPSAASTGSATPSGGSRSRG